MEEAVSVSPDPVALALVQSQTAGEEFVPNELLAILNADPNPTSVFNDMDRGNAHFAPVQQDFGFLHTCRVTKKTPSSEEQVRLAGVMRWLRRQFGDWNPAADRNCQTLAAMFVITVHCGQHGDFWPAFFASSSVNPEIVAELTKRIACLQLACGPSERSRSPISDKRILDEFDAADRAGDWATVVSEWPRFGDFLFPDAFLSQSVCYLHAFAWDALRGSTEQLKQIAPVMLVLSSLSVADCLTLAISSTNPYLRIGSILRLFQQQRRRNESISPAVENLLTQLLQNVAADSVQWEQWMLALNRYPVRYPQIQRSLGRALAQAPEIALQPYISSIDLSTTGISRSTVAECLRAFRAGASIERRKAVWTFAHERWMKWGFGKNDPTETLMRIGRCELDYAIVGYALECMTAEQHNEICATLATDLSLIDESWHASATAFIQAVSLILSTFQPYAYARQDCCDHDWLMPEGEYCLPFDPHTDHYRAMFYMVRYLIPGFTAKKV